MIKKMLLLTVLLFIGLSGYGQVTIQDDDGGILFSQPVDQRINLHLDNYEKLRNSADSAKGAGVFLIAAGAAIVGAAIIPKNGNRNIGRTAKIGLGCIGLGTIAFLSGTASQSKAEKELIKAIRL